MTDVIISPVPYGGGSVVTSQTSRDLIFVNNSYTKWVYAFRQTSPNYSYLGLVEISPSLKHPSPTITYVKQRAYVGNVWNNPKLFKISDNRVLVVHDVTNTTSVTVSVYDISNDFVRVATGTLPKINVASHSVYSVIENNDNSFYWLYISAGAGNYQFVVNKYTFTDGATAFTLVVSRAGQSTTTALSSIRYKKIQSVSNKYIIFGTDATLNMYRIGIYDTSTDTLQMLSSIQIIDNDVAVLSPTELIFIPSASQFYVHNGSSTSTLYNEPITTSLINIENVIEMGNYNFIGFDISGFTPTAYQVFHYNSNQKRVATAFNYMNGASLSYATGMTYRVKGAGNNNYAVFYVSPTDVMYVMERATAVQWLIRVLTFE